MKAFVIAFPVKNFPSHTSEGGPSNSFHLRTLVPCEHHSRRVYIHRCSLTTPKVENENELEQLTDLVRKGNIRKAVETLRVSSLANQVKTSKKLGLTIAQQLLNAAPALLPKRGRDNSKSQAPKKSEEDQEKDAQLLYTTLRELGMLQAFGSLANPSSLPLQEKIISTDKLVERAGVPISALSPKRGTLAAWRFSGVAVLLTLALTLNALKLEALIQPLGLVFGLIFVSDQVLLRGAAFEAIYRTLFPQYADKVLRHEASHFLLAYLQGCPIRGYILSAIDAVRSGIPGQAGTIFSDGDFRSDLNSGRLRSASIDRFTIVLMAGIAGEALCFGQAEGGRSDELGLVSLLTSLKPPWSSQAVFNQARWAVLEALLLLKKNRNAYEKLVEKMKVGAPLGDCIACIEENVDVEKTRVPEGLESRNKNEAPRTGKDGHARAMAGKDIEEQEKLLDEKIQALDAQLEELQDNPR